MAANIEKPLTSTDEADVFRDAIVSKQDNFTLQLTNVLLKTYIFQWRFRKIFHVLAAMK
jgi:hypothetical protein